MVQSVCHAHAPVASPPNGMASATNPVARPSSLGVTCRRKQLFRQILKQSFHGLLQSIISVGGVEDAFACKTAKWACLRTSVRSRAMEMLFRISAVLMGLVGLLLVGCAVPGGIHKGYEGSPEAVENIAVLQWSQGDSGSVDHVDGR